MMHGPIRIRFITLFLHMPNWHLLSSFPWSATVDFIVVSQPVEEDVFVYVCVVENLCTVSLSVTYTRPITSQVKTDF